MSDVIKTGDEVEITIRGTVGEYQPSHAVTHEIKSANGTRHFVFLGGKYSMPVEGETKYGVTVKKTEALEAGQAYQDADGDVLIRAADGRWLTVYGNHYADDYATRPLVKLVPKV